MSNSPYDPQSSPYQQSQHNPYAQGNNQPYGGGSPYDQAQQHNPYGAPQQGQQDPYGQQPQAQQNPYGSQGADDDATVMAPAGWQHESQFSTQNADSDDDATVMAPAGWQHESQGQQTQDDDATVLAPSGWSQTSAAPAEQASDHAGPTGTGHGGGLTAYQPGGQPSADPYAQQSSFSQPSADPYSQQSAPVYAPSASDPYGQPSAQPSANPYSQPSAPYSQPSAQQFSQYQQPQQGYAEPQGYNGQMGAPMGAPVAGPAGGVDENGMFRQGAMPSQLSPQDERSQAAMAHWLAIIIGIWAPLIIMLTSGEKSPWVKQHAKQSMNLEITLLIAYVIGSALSIVFVGFFIILAAWIAGLVFHLQGMSAANKGENYKCPIAIQLVK